MSKDHREHQGAGGAGAQVQQRGERPAPGKVTPSSKLPAGRGGAVQPEARAGSGAAAPPVQSVRDWTLDPWMDAAHRGTPVPGASGAVQKQEADAPAQEGAQGATQGASVDVDALVASLRFEAPAVGAGDNALDIADALTWVENAQQRIAQGVQAYDSFPADDVDSRSRVGAAVEAAAGQAAGHMTTMATTMRDHLQTLLTRSSPVEETPPAGETPAQAPEQPTLPAVADVDRMTAAASGLSHTAHGTSAALPEDARATLAAAAGEVADAALAIYQARAVLSARADWVVGYRQDTLPSADAADGNAASSALRREDGARDGLNDVFADSGFNRYGVDAERNRSGNWEAKDWCGMFVGTHLFRGGGMDGELRPGMWETSNVNDFFNYTQVSNSSRIPVTVWVPGEGRWMDLRAYHQLRGSERTWTARQAIEQAIAAGGNPFRSGDVCLIDHDGVDVAEHIVMVDSYDASTGELRTIEGNTLGIRSSGDGLVERNAEGSFEKDSGDTSVGIHIREMNGERPEREGRRAYQNRAGNTVVGRGRLSVVDFEDHRYATLPLADFPEAALEMSPEQMSEDTREQARVTRSRPRGTATSE